MANNPYDELGVAAHQILRLRAQIAEAVARKNAALVAIHRSGIPKCYVAPTAQTSLAIHGFSEDQINSLALSPSSVRLALDASEQRERSQPEPADLPR